MNTIYQIQLETDNNTFSFEIATDDCDAVEWAEAYLASELDEYGPFHVGGYCSIGYTEKTGVLNFKKYR